MTEERQLKAPQGLVGLYQIYDTKAELVLGPIMAHRNPGPAVRDFYGLLENPQTQPGQYPKDFELIWIGMQHTETGAIDAATTPIVVATGKDWNEELELHGGGCGTNLTAR